MHDLLAGASLPHAPPLPPPPLARLAGVGWALRGSGETVPPPRRADLSRRALYLHSFEFTTDLGRDQRENGSSLLNQGVMAKKKKKKAKPENNGGHAVEGPGPRMGLSRALCLRLQGSAQHPECGTGRGSARGRAGAHPGAGRHPRGQTFHGRLLSACDHIWSGEEATWPFGFQLSARAQTVSKVPLLPKMRLRRRVGCKLPTYKAFHQSLVSYTG